MKVVNLKNYPNYFITQHGEVFKIAFGKEVRIPAYYIDYKLYVRLDNQDQKELIYLMLQAFDIEYKPTDRLKFKVSKGDLRIDLCSIKVTPLKPSTHIFKDDTETIIVKYGCNIKADTANNRFHDKITGYEVASILVHQKFLCSYCGKGINQNDWQIDHFHPKTHGGKNVFNNIVCSCSRCNRMKHTMNGNEFIMVANNIVKHNMKFSINLNK